MTQRGEHLEYPFVLGTAGHIDHGKTSLIKAMTGYDCDRLKEEKKRGITIELGFAPLSLPDGTVISVVDVPGHEKFIRQMVAGAAGIQGVLFVVAADEGVMPQTREHLDILGLLGVSNGVIALTKIDMVDQDLMEMAREDVLSSVRGTFLEGAPLVPVSSHTGEGIDLLAETLQEMVGRASSRPFRDIFFYPVDRVFPKQGYGTVVTGTAWGGAVEVGEELQILPQDLTARVRGLQVHNAGVSRAEGGQRIAINLAGVKGELMSRGDVLVPLHTFVPSCCCNVMLRVLSGTGERLRHWQRIHVHMGTSEIMGRLVFFDRKELLPGESCAAQIVLEEPQAVMRGERFILRSGTPVRTLAGGQVILPGTKKVRGKADRQEQNVRTLELEKYVEHSGKYLDALIKAWGWAFEEELRYALQLPRKSFAPLMQALKDKKEILLFGENNRFVLSKNYAEELEGSLEEEVRRCLEKDRNLRGLSFEKLLASRVPLKDPKILRLLGEEMAARSGHLLLEDDLFRHDAFLGEMDALYDAQKPLLLGFCERRDMQFPSLEEVREELGLKEEELKNVLEEARKNGEIALIGEHFILSREIEQRVLGVLQDFAGEITLSAVRDVLGSTRKYILPLLEYFDSRGYTRRVADKRILRKRA